MNSVITRVCELGIMASGAAFIAAPRIGIYTNDVSPTKGSVKATFTPAAFTGYAVKTPTASAVYVTQPGNLVSVDLSDVVFDGPTSGAGTDAYGWYCYDNVTNDLYCAGRFSPGPLSLQNPLDRITLGSTLSINGTATSAVET